jgi:SAM-dependent methyltransferase
MALSLTDRGGTFHRCVFYGVNASRFPAIIYSENESAIDLCRMRRQFSVAAKNGHGNMRCAKECVGLINALRHTLFSIRYRVRQPVAGRFQPYRHTLPDRYPWLFGFAATSIKDGPDCRLLSFGCSRGEEVSALRRYFPQAEIKGIDFDRHNIARCRARSTDARMRFAVAATTDGESAESYDAIFCLAVLCHGYLTISGARRCDPLLHFTDFERMASDFARCLKPGGLLLLHTTSFRFCDTAVAANFDVLLEAEPAQMAADVHFGPDNRLLGGERYRAVAFRKRASAPL